MNLFTDGGESSQIVRAFVVDNKDPDKKGRVKVRYPWFQKESGESESHWARVARQFTGQEYGEWFLPEIDDEVLVLIEGGQLDAPIVISSLFNGEHLPPKMDHPGDFNQDGKNELRFLKTKSGHLLAFDDHQDSQSILLSDSSGRELKVDTKEQNLTLKDQSGHKISLDEKNQEIQLQSAGERKIALNDKDKKITVQDGGGNKIEIDESSGQILLKDKNGNELTLSSSGIDLKDKGGNEISLSSGEVKVVGSGKISLGDGASEPLIKGMQFMSVFNSHIHQVPQSLAGVNPSSPPMPLMTPAHLSKKTFTE